MVSKVSRAGVALVVLAAAAGSAFAEGEWSGNVALSSEYVWRGVSQSNSDPAISGGFDYSNGMFYAGTWASNVDFQDEPEDTNMEIDFYGGIAGETEGGLSWDVGVIYYAYPDADTADYDFVELKGALGYTFTSGVSVGGAVFWDPDNQNVYVEGSAGYSFTDAFSVDATLGNYSFDAGGDYTTWSLGGTYALPIGLDLGVRYYDTDIDNSDIADERVVFSVSKAL
ncbi:MAG TPA: TorF family putative porin [Hyphomonas sp.]|nr:TorF family putative porin [Hyphomonas sp.]HRX72862.1 TorF family putative porin [Hyphomonas sp.]